MGTGQMGSDVVVQERRLLFFFSWFYFALGVSARNESGYDDQVRWRSEPRVGKSMRNETGLDWFYQ
jgi:hypothetical protein